MMATLRPSFALLLALSAGHGAEPRFQDLVRQFEYDSKAPLNIREDKKEQRDGATVIELSYDSPGGARVPAALIVPEGKGPFAGILFGHWMMPGSSFRNRKEFFDEAILLAHSGAVSLLTDAPMVRPGFLPEKDALKGEIQSAEASRQQVIDFRRGLDLLLERGDVDPGRIAFVGHSFNAHIGGILSGVEKRIGSFVLMAGVFADQEYVFNSTRPEVAQFRQKIGDQPLRDFFQKYAFDDPVHYIGHSAPAAVFLQFGKEDEGIPEKMARGYFERFAEPKKMEFYKAGHALNRKARQERIEWLAERLKLPPIDREAIERIPDLEEKAKD